MNDQPRVYIVLVNWNGHKESIECIESILRLNYTNFRIVLCDNDSTDGSVNILLKWAENRTCYQAPDNLLSKYTTPPLLNSITCQVIDADSINDCRVSHEELVLINTGGNLGFAGGNNVGIRFALSQRDCDYIWLLNNDTVVVPETLDYLVERATNDNEIGMVGATIHYYHQPDIIQALGGARFNKYLAMSYLFGITSKFDEIKEDEISGVEPQIDWVSGACMLMPIQFIKEVGFMDERYFLYFEELDWALRAKGKFKLAFAPKAKIFHKHGSTTNENKQSDVSVYFRCRSRLKLYRKLLPRYLFFCLVATLKDALFCIKKGKFSLLKPMWRAVSDEFNLGR